MDILLVIVGLGILIVMLFLAGIAKTQGPHTKEDDEEQIEAISKHGDL